MATITGIVSADERTWQGKFYEQLFGSDYENYVSVDRSTDGHTTGILFEHKQNVRSYGENKALGQALIYLTRFNRDGVPVPAKICLVGQDEQKCYVYDTANYMNIVNDIEKYANLKASDSIAGFTAGAPSQIIDFDMSSAIGMQAVMQFVQQAPQTVKVDITVHNVYGWSGFYYDNAPEYNQKPEKKKFFDELRNPVGTLANYINPWTGKETDFKFIMDMLNDPMTQKKLGAFYTPPQYAKLACGLVRDAIKRAMDAGKKDYVIIDRCAGTGNLEMYLEDEGDDILSHVIVSTYELKEWMVLKDRFGNRVRYIIPPIPTPATNPDGSVNLPDLNEDGFLSGANALTRDIIDNAEVRKYLDDPDCAIILFENPPYAETTTTIKVNGKTSIAKAKSDWKSGDTVIRMMKDVSGVATNDIGNVFIWSAFKDFLRQDTDSYIVFSPVKYWKAQGLAKQKFVKGFAFNRLYFHAPTDACIMCAEWSGEPDIHNEAISLDAKNIINDEVVDEGCVVVKKVHTKYSDVYFDTRTMADDTNDGIVCEINGQESSKPDNKIVIEKKYNDNLVGYMTVFKFGFDNPRLCGILNSIGMYNGHGFFVRSDNFMEKLPLFAASRYTDHCNDWKVMSMIMKSADKSAQYEADVKSGKLDKFLFQTMFWTCMSHYPHMRSLHGSDGRLYLNQLCFDGDTLAKQKLDEYLAKGYKLTDKEQELWNKMQKLLVDIQSCDEYRSDFRYGLYQIDEEINVKIKVGTKGDGTDKMDWKYGDLNNDIKTIKALAKQYYIDNLVDTLFEYEFLK